MQLSCKTQSKIKPEARYREVGGIRSLSKNFFNIYYHSHSLFSSSKFKPPQLRVFLTTIDCIRSLSGHQMTCAPWGKFDHLFKKAQKCAYRNTAVTITTSLVVQICISSISSNVFQETQVEILGLVCERKRDSIHQNK